MPKKKPRRRAKKLVLAKTLKLPLDAVTQTFGFMAKRGAGKTYAAQKLAEEMLRSGAQVVALDPVGNWWGLRLAADGKSKGVDIPVFGGLHGDLPLRPQAGALIADVLIDTGTSAIVDVSQFRKAERKRFVCDFCEQLFRRRKADPSAMHVFFEEAQVFVPQRFDGGSAQMVGAVEDIVRLGRNFGIGSTLISQRPQSVNKEVLNQVEALVLLQINGAQERKAIEDWVRYKGLNVKEMVDALPSLKVGDAFIWSPQWLGVFERIHVAEKWTYDASATPKVGTRKKARRLAPLELEAIESSMSSIVEEQAANDPALLKKEISKLKRELKAGAGKRGSGISAAERKELESVAFDRGVSSVSGQYEKKLKALKRQLEANLRAIPSQLEKVVGSVKSTLEICEDENFTHAPSVKPRATKPAPRGRVSSVTTPKPRVERSSANGGLPRARQRILDALAWLEVIGIERAHRTQLAFLSDQKPTSGGYKNHLGALRSAGYIGYPGSGLVSLSDEGRADANHPEAPPTNDELHAMIFAKLAPARQRILGALIEVYPDCLTREDLAEQSAQKPTSGGYKNHLGAMRSLGLLDYPEKGAVAATDILFLE